MESRLSLEGSQVLDLFAGSGALGFEALSRGAARVHFVDADNAAIRSTRENAEKLGVLAQCIFSRVDAMRFLTQPPHAQFSLILADPPYELPELPRLPDLSTIWLSDPGLFVLEHDVRHNFRDHPLLDTARPYGRTTVSIFRKITHVPA